MYFSTRMTEVPMEFRFPGTGTIDSYDQPCGLWESFLGCLDEQPVLLITKPSLSCSIFILNLKWVLPFFNEFHESCMLFLTAVRDQFVHILLMFSFVSLSSDLFVIFFLYIFSGNFTLVVYDWLNWVLVWGIIRNQAMWFMSVILIVHSELLSRRIILGWSLGLTVTLRTW